MKNVLTFCVACALLAVSTNAIAQQLTPAQKQAMADRLKTADSNGDGFISKAEADAKLPRIAKNFAKLDLNRDGVLSPEELKAVAHMIAERRP